jgi:hypothetical protein
MRFEVETKSASKTKEALFQFAVNQQTTIVEISEKAQNLEQVFQQLTR